MNKFGSVSNAVAQKQNHFKRAYVATKHFFKKHYASVASTIIIGSSIVSSSFAQSKYNMPVITNQRSSIQKKDYYSNKIKSLVPDMISAGIFSNEKEAFDAIESSDFMPYLRQIADSQNSQLKEEFSNGFNYFTRTNFTDSQYSFSIFNNDATSVSAPISIGSIFYSYSPTRLNDSNLKAYTTTSPSDTVHYSSLLYTTWYANVHTFGASMRINLDETFIYNLGASYTFVTNTKDVNVPPMLKLQLTNIGQRGCASIDYIGASFYPNSSTIYDVGVSAGSDYIRGLIWANDISNTNSSSFNLGIQVSPNAFFSEEVNRNFSCTLYSLFQERSNKYENLSGARVDFNIANSVYLNATVEYNTDLSIKPTEWSYWFNLSIPFQVISNVK